MRNRFVYSWPTSSLGHEYTALCHIPSCCTCLYTLNTRTKHTCQLEMHIPRYYGSPVTDVPPACLVELIRSVTELSVWKWAGVHEKPDLLEFFTVFTSAVHASLAGVRGGPNLPAEKIEFQMQFPAVLRGLIGFFLVDLLSRSQFPTPSPSLFLCKFGLITRPIFSKSGEICTRQTAPWLRRWIRCRKTAKYWTREVEQLANVYTYFISWVSNSSNTVNPYL